MFCTIQRHYGDIEPTTNPILMDESEELVDEVTITIDHLRDHVITVEDTSDDHENDQRYESKCRPALLFVTLQKRKVSEQCPLIIPC